MPLIERIPKEGNNEADRSLLTVVVPTHNRPRHLVAQLRFFKACGLKHAIVVADSSAPAAAEIVRAACAGMAEYRRFDPTFVNKLLEVIRSIETPFVALAPDDDITFPHAIDDALAHLVRHRDYTAAHGYILRFGMNSHDFDIHSVYSYVPSISNDDPLVRLYDLMRRYQPFFWATFRRDALLLSMEISQRVDGAAFHELMCMSTAALQGKVATLPLIYAMRGMEESSMSKTTTDPFFWFIHDTQSFFQAYGLYRGILTRFIREQRIIPENRHLPHPLTAEGATLEHLIDIVNATFLGRTVDTGVVNYAAQRLLGYPIAPIPAERQWLGPRELTKRDLVRSSRLSDRRYIWRSAVIEAEPREEIYISSDETVRVEQALEAYRLD